MDQALGTPILLKIMVYHEDLACHSHSSHHHDSDSRGAPNAAHGEREVVRIKASQIVWRKVSEVCEDRSGVENSAVFIHGVCWGSHDNCAFVSFGMTDLTGMEDILC